MENQEQELPVVVEAKELPVVVVEAKETYCKLPNSLREALLVYLLDRPAKEVISGINLLQNLEQIKD